MDVDLPAIVGLVTGSGGTVAVMLLWMRDINRHSDAIARDRDWWRDYALRQREISGASLDGLESRSTG